ncbi:MAG: radical SAM protein [Clostridia bacterium]|nr:radical SAM protein [Clostridia bacterium]
MNSINNVAYPIVDHCNLNCRGCCRFCNPSQEKHFADPKIFEKDLRRFKELVEHIEMFRIFGGEPLLHPELSKFIYIARDIYPKSEIDIVTNGLLLDKMSDELINDIKSCCVHLEISVYEPTKKKLPKIMDILEKNKLGHTLNFVDKFWKRMDMSGSSDYVRIWKECQWKKCNGLRDGKFMMCPLPVVIKEFNRLFDTDFNFDDELIDIYDPKLTFEDIRDFISRPHKYCSYCTDPEFLEWSAFTGEIKAEDYAVIDACGKRFDK